jgi:hypothetical protein
MTAFDRRMFAFIGLGAAIAWTIVAAGGWTVVLAIGAVGVLLFASAIGGLRWDGEP